MTEGQLRITGFRAARHWRRRLPIVYRCHGRKKVIVGNAQGIEAEIPQELRSNSEELERKARFLRAWHAKMRPNEEGANSYALGLDLTRRQLDRITEVLGKPLLSKLIIVLVRL